MTSRTIGIDASRTAVAQPTGTERYSQRIITEILALGVDHRFRLYLNRRVPIDIPQRASTLQRPIPFPRLWTHLRLSAELALHPVDILFIPAHVVPPLHPAATVVTIHDLGYLSEPQAHDAWARRYLDWSTRWSVRVARRIIAISEATRADLIRHYRVPPERVKVIYHGVDERFRPASERDIARACELLGVSGHFVLFVGTLQPRKNLTRLVEAFDLVADDDPDLRLVLAGRRGWKMDEIDRALNASRHRDRILQPGHVPDADLPAIYSSASAVALPSLYEGFGLPVLEAMACGTPVLISDRGALPEVAGDAAVVVDPLEPAAIAAGLRQALDASTRAQRVAAGRAQAARFRWDAAGKATLDLLIDSYSAAKD